MATIDVGNFYLLTMKERLTKAEAATPPPVTKRDVDAFREAFRKTVTKDYAGTFKFNQDREDIDNQWLLDCKIHIEAGITVEIDHDRLSPSHRYLAGLKEVRTRAKANRDACAKACEIRDLMDTAEINKFKAFVRASKSQPSREDCERLLKDFLALRGHVCPV